MSVRSYLIEKFSSSDSMVSYPNDMNNVAFFCLHDSNIVWDIVDDVYLFWCDAWAFLLHTFIFCLYETDNKIGDDGANAIAEALKTNNTLTGLYLYSKYHTPSSLILSWLSIRLSHHACVYDDEKHEKKKECETCLYGPIRSRSFLLQIRWFQTQMIWTVLHSSHDSTIVWDIVDVWLFWCDAWAF